jgi:hypothetical protein
MGKRKSPWDMGDYTPTKEEAEAMRWCIRNKIYITPVAIRESRWTIEILNNSKTSTDPNNYKKLDIWIKMYEYYKYYYEKYENKI